MWHVLRGFTKTRIKIFTGFWLLIPCVPSVRLETTSNTEGCCYLPEPFSHYSQNRQFQIGPKILLPLETAMLTTITDIRKKIRPSSDVISRHQQRLRLADLIFIMRSSARWMSSVKSGCTQATQKYVRTWSGLGFKSGLGCLKPVDLWTIADCT
jgi:hypothetical protein